MPPLTVPPAELTSVIKETLTDQVQLPRLYLAWHSPALYAKGDAELDVTSGVLGSGKNSRLYKRLVYELQLAQDVTRTAGVVTLRLVLHGGRDRAAVAGRTRRRARSRSRPSSTRRSRS